MAVAAFDFARGRKQPTPKDMFTLSRLAQSPGVALQSSAPRRRAVPPTIPAASKHHGYALAIIAGYSHKEACALLKLNPRTVEGWRRKLLAAGKAYSSHLETYELCAKLAIFDEKMRDELRSI